VAAALGRHLRGWSRPRDAGLAAGGGAAAAAIVWAGRFD
jgi:hypothetical protein